MNAYTDVDWEGKIDDRKSTSGGALFLGKRLVTWTSKKQTCTLQSTEEAEYVAAAQATKEIVWLRKILDDLQETQTTSTTLFVDSNSAIQLAKNPKFHDRTKHINTKYHLIRYHVEAKTIQLKHCSTEEQIADIFTKALGCVKFEQF